jgi:hypothetical protein
VLKAAALIAACVALAAAPAGARADPVVFAAGDIACDPLDARFNNGIGVPGACQQQATADLMVDGTFDAVLALGDLQYQNGTLANFRASYDLSWGRVKPRTRPVIGNHEGTTATQGAGYCAYFGAAAHCNASGRQGGAAFYSFDLEDWHVVVLNSNCEAAGGCERGSPQYEWLEADLEDSPRPCTLAAWHHPRWSSGHDGSNVMMAPIWELFWQLGGDVVLSGHSHDYERFAPIGDDDQVDRSDGIRSFVVGTGGASFTGLGNSSEVGSQTRQNATFGLLRLALHATSYDWDFVPVAGSTFTDRGTAFCRGFSADGDVQAPRRPSGLGATAASFTSVDLAWPRAIDNAGVTGYEISRGEGNGALAPIATVAAAARSYADVDLVAATTYRYQLRAHDAAGNVSAPSAAVSVTTPPVPPPTVPARLPPPVAPPAPAPFAPLAPAAAPRPQARGTLLARWRLRPAVARRSLARGWVSVPKRRSARTVVRVQVGRRTAARRVVSFRRGFKLRLARWSMRQSRRGQPVTITIRLLR